MIYLISSKRTTHLNSTFIIIAVTKTHFHEKLTVDFRIQDYKLP